MRPYALHCRTLGLPEHPAIVFLHGFMGSGSDWDPVMAQLADSHYCVAMDLPGHGRSRNIPISSYYTFEGAAASILATMRVIGLRGHPMLVGYSMGGRLALCLASHARGVFSRTVLVSSSPGLRDSGEREARCMRDDDLAEQIEGADFATFLDEWYDQPLFASLRLQPELLKRVKAARLRNDVGELARALRGMSTGRQPSFWPGLPELDMPVLSVNGELDEAYVDLAGDMAGLCRLGTTVIVPGAGHTVHLEQPDTLVAVLREFWSTGANTHHV